MVALTSFTPDYDKWSAPESLLIALQEPGLKTRDKVELVFAFYAHDHRGQGPFASEIAEILSISKQNVESRMVELIATGRAQKLHGKFALIRSDYTHPLIIDLLEGGG